MQIVPRSVGYKVAECQEESAGTNMLAAHAVPELLPGSNCQVKLSRTPVGLGQKAEEHARLLFHPTACRIAEHC
jgi:hypothetical protein